MTSYGGYGIALDKNKVIRNNRIQPIHYMNPASPLVADFKEAFNANYNVGKKAHKEDEVLLNYLLSTLLYRIWLKKTENIKCIYFRMNVSGDISLIANLFQVFL